MHGGIEGWLPVLTTRLLCVQKEKRQGWSLKESIPQHQTWHNTLPTEHKQGLTISCKLLAHDDHSVSILDAGGLGDVLVTLDLTPSAR